MKVDATPDVNITYGQLESLLVRIGYVRVKTSAYRAYREPSTDTLLLFPLTADEVHVPFHQVQMARVNSVQRGVIYEKEFDDQLIAATHEKSAAVLA